LYYEKMMEAIKSSDIDRYIIGYMESDLNHFGEWGPENEDYLEQVLKLLSYDWSDLMPIKK
jgi:hypothetical protein